jgi:hypothetical protein
MATHTLAQPRTPRRQARPALIIERHYEPDLARHLAALRILLDLPPFPPAPPMPPAARQSCATGAQPFEDVTQGDPGREAA